MRTLIIAFLLFTPILNAVAQEGTEAPAKKEFNELRHGLGVAAGLTSAYGLSYRHFFNRFGLQLTFAPYATSSETYYSKISETTLHTGLTFLYYLTQGDKSGLFLYQSNYLYFSKYKQENTDPNPLPWSPPESNSTKSYFNNGLGVGIEFIIVKRVSFNLMFGYGAFENFETIDFTAETGLFYKF